MRHLSLLLFLGLWTCMGTAAAQNVGIGTATPQTRLDINGDIGWRTWSLTLVNGANGVLSPSDTYSAYRITGPTAAFSIDGIANGQDGRIITLYNATTQTMTINNTFATAGTGIRAGSAALSIAAWGSATLQFSGTENIWVVTNSANESINGWLLDGNSNGALRTIGTNDNFDLALETNGTEKVRIINGNGNNGVLGVGLQSLPSGAITSVDPYATLVVMGNGISHGDINIASAGNTNFVGYTVSSKARGTLAAPLIVQNGDMLSVSEAWGYDGTGYRVGSSIYATVDGTPGANDMPTRLAFSTTADGASGPTERMRITNAGNVGIGTTAPERLLHVVGSLGNKGIKIEGSDTGLFIEDTGTNPSEFKLYNNEGLGVWQETTTGGTTGSRLFIAQATGHVGIGSTTPGTQLVVAKNVTDGSILKVHNSGNTAGIHSWIGFSADDAFGTGDINDRARIGMEVSALGPGSLFFTTGAYNGQVERMRITENGNVGIGIITPDITLDIAGDAAGKHGLQLRSGNTNSGSTSNQMQFGFNGTNTYRHALKTRHNAGGTAGNAFDFYLWDQTLDAAANVGTRAVMTIDGNHEGMVGIGITTPKSELHISDGSSSLKTVTDAGGFGASVLITDNAIPRIYFEVAGQAADKKMMGLTALGQTLSIGSLNDAANAWDRQYILSAHRDGRVGIGIGTPDASAALDISATDKGLLIPRVALTATNAASPVASPTASLLVYNTATAGTSPNTVTPGYYYWNGASWQRFDTGNNTGDWKLDGNSNGALRTIGTNDNFDLALETNGTERVRINTAGDVGIGTAAPTAGLHIAVPADENNNPEGNGIYVLNSGNAGDNDDAIIAARVGGSAAGDAFISLDVSGVTGWSIGLDNSDGDKLKFANAWNEPATNTRMTIQTDGNVGIGTTTPAIKLDVNGYLKVGTTDASAPGTNAASEGMMRYNSTKKCMEYNNGYGWICMGQPNIQNFTLRDAINETATGSSSNISSYFTGGYGQQYNFTVNNVVQGQQVLFIVDVVLGTGLRRNNAFNNSMKIYGNGIFIDLDCPAVGSDQVASRHYTAAINASGNLTYTFECNMDFADVRITTFVY